MAALPREAIVHWGGAWHRLERPPIDREAMNLPIAFAAEKDMWNLRARIRGSRNKS